MHMSEMQASSDGTILLTGASGMLGFYILRDLLNSWNGPIILMVRQGSALDMIQTLDWDDRVHLVRMNSTEIHVLDEIFKEVSVVIHAAANLGFGASLEDLQTDNVNFTRDLINLSLDHVIDQFIYVSTVAALNRTKNKGFISEKDRFEFPKQASEYGKSKFLAEREVWRGYAEGLNTLIYYPSQILGLGHANRFNTQIITYFMKLRKFYPQGNLGVVDVRDVSKSIILGLKRYDINGESIVLNGHNLSYAQLINQVRKINGQNPLTSPLPTWLHRYGAPIFAMVSWLKGERNPLNRHYLRQIRKDFKYDAGKSKDLLGLRYTNLDQTLRDMIERLNHGEFRDFYLLPKYSYPEN